LVSQPDPAPTVGIDFAPPRRRTGTARPLLALVVVVLMLGALSVGVTQLLLR
jgi:hypothetical protein